MGTWTGTISTGPDTAGHVPTATEMQTWYDVLNALSSAWTAYTPTWTSSGTAPVLGNGTLIGSYLQVGKFAVCKVRLTMGSTTTYGSANAWSITLPVTAADTLGTGAAYVFDTSNTPGKLPAALLPNTTNVLFLCSAVSGGTGGPAALAVPHAWGQGDQIAFTYLFEVA